MPQKKKPKTVSKTSVPDNYFSPFTNLTNNLSLQHHQNSFTQQLSTDPLTETEKHDDMRFPVYMDNPLNETRYPVNIYSF